MTLYRQEKYLPRFNVVRTPFSVASTLSSLLHFRVRHQIRVAKHGGRGSSASVYDGKDLVARVWISNVHKGEIRLKLRRGYDVPEARDIFGAA
jgi:hypothetical protein